MGELDASVILREIQCLRDELHSAVGAMVARFEKADERLDGRVGSLEAIEQRRVGAMAVIAATVSVAIAAGGFALRAAWDAITRR